MLVDFNTLPEDARIWIYQSSRIFTEQEIKILEREVADFIDVWTRHGDAIKGGFSILYKQFLVLAIDESHATASGCSIDSSVNFIKKTEERFSVDMLNKLNLSYKVGEEIFILNLADFQKAVETNKITSQTIVFNNMVQTKADLLDKWEVPANKSWHRRFFKEASV